MFSSLFSSKNTEDLNQKVAPISGIVSRMKGFAGKVSMILGLASVGNAATSGPTIPDAPTYSQATSVIENPIPITRALAISKSIILPPKGPGLPEQKDGQIEPISIPPKMRAAKAEKWESVGIFMLKNFGTEEGWEFLVEKDTGKRVRVATRDLIAGRTYILARNETEARSLVSIFEKKIVKNSVHMELKPVQSSQLKMDTTIHSTWKKISYLWENVLKEVEKLGLNFDKYLHSIASIESNHKYNIDNVSKGKELNIDSSKWAFGKYQFTNETLRYYGITTPKQRSLFRRDPVQQENIMIQYTLEHIQYMMNEPIFVNLIKSGVQPNHILSAMHHMGVGWVTKIVKNSIDSSNPVATFFQKLKSSSDWLNTSTSDYVKGTSRKYDTAMEEVPRSRKNENDTWITIVSRFTPENEVPEIMVAKTSINDDAFDTEKSKNLLKVAFTDTHSLSEVQQEESIEMEDSVLIIHTETIPTIWENSVHKVATEISSISSSQAVNDPHYISTPEVRKVMGQVISLQNYLKNKTNLTQIESELLEETPRNIAQIDMVEKNIDYWAGKSRMGVEGAKDTVVKLQVAKGTIYKRVITDHTNYFKYTKGSAGAKVIDQLTLAAQDIDEKVIPLSRFLEKQEQQKTRQVQINTLWDARLHYATGTATNYKKMKRAA